jgi:3-oxoacyl-[acyl-carrier-protein] synthase-3
MIQAIASHLPPNELSNEKLSELYEGWTPDRIFEKTGIRRRFVSAPDECPSDLAFHAAEKLFQKIDRNEVDFLILCTQTPDYFLPTTACVLQHRLRLSTACGALDFNLGCSGYVYGLAIAQSLIQAGTARRVLLLTAENYSRYIHPLDKSTRTIFGDGASATLLSADSPRKLHSFVFGTDGRGAGQIMVKTGAARFARSEQSRAEIKDASGNVRSDDCLFMNGPEIFNFTLKAVPELVRQVLERAKLPLEEIDSFVFHQANGFLLEHLRKKIGIPKEKFAICLENCGNTVSSTMPITLEMLLTEGKIKSGDRILLAGFGVGLSWAGCLLEWKD